MPLCEKESNYLVLDKEYFFENIKYYQRIIRAIH